MYDNVASYLSIHNAESENMIEERLGFGVMIGDSEDLSEQLLDKLPVGVCAEALVEGEEGPGRSQTVSSHL